MAKEKKIEKAEKAEMLPDCGCRCAMAEVKIALIKGSAKMPYKKSTGASCYDLYTCEDTIVKRGRNLIPLGIKMEIPEGWEAVIRSKSGIASKGVPGIPMRIYNTGLPISKELSRMVDASTEMGTIDADYRGEIAAIVYNTGEDFIIPAGVNIAQMKIQRAEEVMLVQVDAKELTDTERGEGGFGSTGIQ